MTSKKILVVDDDQHLRQQVKNILVQQNFEILEANDGEEGLIAAIKNLPNLIILDVEMPKMRGWEVCKILKQNNNTDSIPILILTSRSEISDILVAMQQGADDYLAKPFTEPELIKRVNRLLQL